MGAGPRQHARVHAPRRTSTAASEVAKALARTDEIEITVTGRQTGRKITHPVWFVREGRKLYLLPVSGSDSEWYRNSLKNPTIVVSAKRATLTSKARPITDRARVRDVVEKFRAKYGAEDVKKYYSKFDVAAEVPLG
jgi:hypothetical protein